MLDGRGPFRMLFDAGGTNILTAQAAAAVVGPERALPKTLNVASTVINGVELGGQSYVVADIDPFLRRVEGLDDIGGVLGLEWFVRMPVRIDYARSRITLYDPAQFKGASGTKVAVAKRGRLPQVSGTIDGIAGMFEIDTGSRGSLTLTPGPCARSASCHSGWPASHNGMSTPASRATPSAMPMSLSISSSLNGSSKRRLITR